MRMSHLRYFVEVARTKNITEAAKNLHLSQPSLSFAVKTLEEELGISLLFRHSHSVSLTDAGEKFAAHAERITGSADQLKDLMQRHSNLLAGNLRLGMLWISGYMEIFTLLNEFRETVPVTYELTFDGSDVLLNGLVNRRLHGVFVISSPSYLENKDEFHSVKISTEEYKLIVPCENSLSKLESIRIRDLDGQAIIMPSEKTLLQRQLTLMFQEEGVSPKVLCSTSQSDIAGQLAGAGLGIAFASSTVAEKICSENCRVVPFIEAEKIQRVIYFVMLRELLDYPLTKEFADFVERR